MGSSGYAKIRLMKRTDAKHDISKYRVNQIIRSHSYIKALMFSAYTGNA